MTGQGMDIDMMKGQGRNTYMMAGQGIDTDMMTGQGMDTDMMKDQELYTYMMTGQGIYTYSMTGKRRDTYTIEGKVKNNQDSEEERDTNSITRKGSGNYRRDNNITTGQQILIVYQERGWILPVSHGRGENIDGLKSLQYVQKWEGYHRRGTV
ncbi:unnamed protein product [Mytilus edulis]|uniref:Uncharacterized protein n=1 Tax=Mytilus edulis TaxID=6550 RepID=A0A8S3SI51_MYTED|nr:unnamed protein product [Mytilus edulis]